MQAKQWEQRQQFVNLDNTMGTKSSIFEHRQNGANTTKHFGHTDNTLETQTTLRETLWKHSGNRDNTVREKMKHLGNTNINLGTWATL